MSVFIIAGIITFALGVTLVILLISGRSPAAARLAKLAASDIAEPQARGNIAELGSRTMSSISSVVGPVRRAVGFSENKDLAQRLALAGYRNPQAAEAFYGVKLFAPVLAALLAGFVIKQDPFFWFVAIAAAGFFLPDLWLTTAIGRRRERIRLALPDALDLLVICMEAGLGMDQALIRVGNELKIAHPDLSDEFLIVNMEQRTGKPRIDAWRSLADRTKLEIVRSFVNMLVQTERFGTPLSRALSAFADSLRVKRRQRAEEMAAKTTIKLLFPLVLFIFPSMFIVLLAPAIISITRSMEKFFK
ncbi:MAG TPA: type II secretion system F family protein [Candidatus Angelobacter sp.]|nr:type II secretion system F family protein [Candidatus Angelobacter sp.]